VPRELDWTKSEVEAIVQEYFSMLEKELRAQPYVKAEHRRALLPFLDNRSEGAVEMKHCNISAVLDGAGLPYIHGYKPRKNVQELLRATVLKAADAAQLLRRGSTRAAPRK
jgi:hypothetical protein